MTHKVGKTEEPQSTLVAIDTAIATFNKNLEKNEATFEELQTLTTTISTTFQANICLFTNQDDNRSRHILELKTTCESVEFIKEIATSYLKAKEAYYLKCDLPFIGKIITWLRSFGIETMFLPQREVITKLENSQNCMKGTLLRLQEPLKKALTPPPPPTPTPPPETDTQREAREAQERAANNYF